MFPWLETYKDIYGVYKVIKNINPSYELFLNKKTHALEIHDTSRSHEFSLCKTFDREDIKRDIYKNLFQTKRENMKKLFKQIEEENQALEKRKLDNIYETASNSCKEILSVAGKLNRDLTQEEIRSIIASF